MSINSDGKVEAKLMLVKQGEKSTIVLRSKNSSLVDYNAQLLFQHLPTPANISSLKYSTNKEQHLRKFYKEKLHNLLGNEGAYRVFNFTELIKEGADESLVNEAVIRIVTTTLQKASKYLDPHGLTIVLLDGHENYETKDEINYKTEFARRRNKKSRARPASEAFRYYEYERLARLCDILEGILDKAKEEAGILLKQVQKDKQDVYAGTSKGRNAIKREDKWKKVMEDEILPAARILAQLHPVK
jgi:hypothetical protein